MVIEPSGRVHPDPPQSPSQHSRIAVFTALRIGIWSARTIVYLAGRAGMGHPPDKGGKGNRGEKDRRRTKRERRKEATSGDRNKELLSRDRHGQATEPISISTHSVFFNSSSFLQYIIITMEFDQCPSIAPFFGYLGVAASCVFANLFLENKRTSPFY